MIKEKMIEQDGKLHIVKEQRVKEMLDSIQKIRDYVPDSHGDHRGRWVGSVPFVLAEEWARESGTQIGTKEFAAYLKRKLSDPDYKNLLIKGY